MRVERDRGPIAAVSDTSFDPVRVGRQTIERDLKRSDVDRALSETRLKASLVVCCSAFVDVTPLLFIRLFRQNVYRSVSRLVFRGTRRSRKLVPRVPRVDW